MAIILNHTIVPARDKEASARWFAKIFGLTYEGYAGHFAPVQVNDTLTLDFDNRDDTEATTTPFTSAMRISTPSSVGSRPKA